jgi:hypothetical protein
VMRSGSARYSLIRVRVAQALALAAILSSMALGFSRGDYKPGGKEFPRPNPSPSKLFTIQGTIDSALPLELDAIYGVTNKNCMDTSRSAHIEGAGTQAPDAIILAVVVGCLRQF